MVTTPVDDFVRAYAVQDVIRAHMPGHKGAGLPERLDITEIAGADSLFAPGGIVLESEKNAARLFGSGLTAYSAEGSSLSIRAMLKLALDGRPRTQERPWLLAGRNAHRTLLSAAALLGFDIRWLFPGAGGVLSAEISPRSLEHSLMSAEAPPFAAYLTSPDYLGGMADIRAAADICHRHGVPLLVDNAHGAYLRFLRPSAHPMDLGADMCADSAHKTLPVLTGGGYLHIAPFRRDISRADVKAAMALFASTSPSYLILASLDRCNRLLDSSYRDELAAFADRMHSLKRRLAEAGIQLIGQEPLKLTLRAAEGADGRALKAALRDRGIECEMADPDTVTLMLTPSQGDQLSLIETALLEVFGPCAGIPPRATPALPAPGERVMSIREAMLAPQETLPLSRCTGRVLGADTTGCPPAVPLAVCGERLTEETVSLCRYYGLKELRVVKSSYIQTEV